MQLKAVLSPQFELCYALADAVSLRPAAAWLHTSLPGTAWYGDARLYGRAYWLALPDILDDRPPAASFDELIQAMATVPPELARKRLVRGLFHGEMSKTGRSAQKREWLAFVGLDEAGEGAMEAALGQQGATFLGSALSVLERFRRDFEPAWRERLPALEAAWSRAAELAAASDLAGVAEELGLKVEVANGRLRALRGGYEIGLADIEAAYLIPSFVNADGFWTVADETLPATVFFPFLDPVLAGRVRRGADPWLVCRALGDPTRAAIVRRLAAAPRTGAELMRELGLSRANISHHIFQLREAGLIVEEPAGRAVRLSLRRSTLDGLSKAFRDILGASSAGRRGRRR